MPAHNFGSTRNCKDRPMAFRVEIDETHVLTYLCHPDRGLTDQDVTKLLDFLEDLAHTGEAYRSDVSRRCTRGSTHFGVTYVFADSSSRLRVFRFIISDSAAVFGVLRVRF